MDHTPVNITMEISSEVSAMNITVQLTPDTVDEGTESFSLQLSLLSSELAGRVLLRPNVTIVTIQDHEDGG